MIGFDAKYCLFVMLPGMLIGIWAQMKLMAAYGKYTGVPVESGLTGAQAARRILDQAGLVNMPVEEVEGHLSDHFDPQKKALFLSPENFHGTSIAAVGVAAHEAGHALQQLHGYGMFNFRMALVPITNIASYASMGILMLGVLVYQFHGLLWLAVGLFTIVTLFQLVTLPVEYDASARAKEQLFRLGLVRESERHGVNQVLDAAALTYVAAMVGSVLQLFYFFSAANSSSDDRN
jgi:uncharacterized protein